MRRYRLTESRLRGMIREAVKGVLNEDQQEAFYRMNVLDAMERLIRDYGVNEVIGKLGNEVGWDKMYSAIRHAFNGDSDSYTKAQEMRGPIGY